MHRELPEKFLVVSHNKIKRREVDFMKEKGFVRLLGFLAFCLICLWGMGEMKSEVQAKVKAKTETERLYEKALRAHFKGWGTLGKSGHCYYAYAKHSYTNRKNEIMIVGLQDTVKEIKIPEKIKGKKVTVIKLLDFREITEDIADGSAIYEKICNTKPAESKTRSIMIPRYVEEISSDSFDQQEFLANLKKFRVSSKNKHFKAKAGVLFTKNGKTLLKYPNKRKASTYRISDGVKELSRYSFKRARVDCIFIPNSVKKIEHGAFIDSKLKKISLPKNLRDIGSSAFAGTNLKEVAFPGSVKIIPEGCFADCSQLKKVTIKSGVKKIEAYTFVHCYQLKKLVIPSSVKSIDDPFSEEHHSESLQEDREAWHNARIEIYAKKNSYAYQKFNKKFWREKHGIILKLM